MSKKKTYSARDYEDMIKIELEDAYECLRKELNALEEERDKDLKSPEEIARIMQGELAMRGVTVGGNVNLFFVVGEIEYSTTMREDRSDNKVAAYSIRIFQDNAKDIKSNEMKDLVKKVLAHKSSRDRFNKKMEPIKNTLKMLASKMDDYKSLAARFRLGYTGDPTDLKSIIHKCKQFVLEGKAH